MFSEDLRSYQRIYPILDVVVIAGAWIGAYQLRFSWGLIPVYFGVPPFDVYLAHLPFVILTWLAVFVYGGVYDINRWWHFSNQWRTLLVSSVVALVVQVSVTYLSTKMEISRVFIMFFWLTTVLTLLAYRRLLRAILDHVGQHARQQRRVLVVGDNTFADMFCDRIAAHPEIGLDVQGILVPESRTRVRDSTRSLPVPADYSNLRDIVQKEKIHIVVFALSLEETWRLKGLLSAIEDLSVDIQVLPDVFSVIPLRPGVEDFEGVPLIHIRSGPHSAVARSVKRMFDLLVASLALCFLLPFVLAISMLIKLTSRGTVFYRQTRVGMDGREFSMLKFRTMTDGAEEEGLPVWSMKKDPRRTRLGGFLRKCSLDELPQLWNVLKGEMSLVGPRPERPEFITSFQQRIPAYVLRHKVKSGLTGLAQVRGWRGATSLEKRIECDIQYIEEWSLGLDLRILCLTLLKGFLNKSEQ